MNKYKTPTFRQNLEKGKKFLLLVEGTSICEISRITREI